MKVLTLSPCALVATSNEAGCVYHNNHHALCQIYDIVAVLNVALLECVRVASNNINLHNFTCIDAGIAQK